MKRIVSEIMLVLLVTNMLALAVRISAATPAEGPAPLPRVLRADQALPGYIDPAVGTDLTSVSCIINLYDPLVFPNNVGNVSTQGSVKPWIATSWTASADGLKWAFTIRQGIMFHSGRTLNASDVAFSMNRLLAIGQGYAYMFEPYVANATAMDQWTAVFNMREPFGPFLTSLVELYIVDSTTVTSHIVRSGPYGTYGDYGTGWLSARDAGSGPFTVKQYLLYAYLNMTRFSDYWGYVAPLAPTEYDVIGQVDPTAEYTAMLNKEVEISSAWLPEQTLDSLANVSGIYVANIAEPYEYYYMMNLLHPPLDDIHVRKALAYCLDYETMVSKLYPRNTVATSCVPACVAGYANTTIYQYNVTAAEAELKQSKYYPDIINDPDKYAINFYWFPEVPIREQDALFFATDAQAIGLKVNVIREPWTRFVEEVFDPGFSGMASVVVDSDFPEAGSMLELRYSGEGGNWMQMEWFNDSTFDSMLETTLSTLNMTQRYAEYAELQQYIISKCVGINVCDVPQVTAVQSYVKWPMAQDPSQAVPVMGYNYDGRLIEIESKPDTHDVAVANILCSKTVVGQNCNCSMNVTVADKGGFSETFNVTVSANTTTIGTQTLNNMLNWTSTTLTFVWNTSSFAYGNYTVAAHATPVPSETNTEDNTFTVGSVLVTIPGDLNGDFKVTLSDLVILAQTYGSKLGNSNWNPNADIDGNGTVGLSDLVILAQHYGQH